MEELQDLHKTEETMARIQKVNRRIRQPTTRETEQLLRQLLKQS